MGSADTSSHAAHRVVRCQIDAAQRLAEVTPDGGAVVPRAGETTASSAAKCSASAERAFKCVVAVVLERRRVADPGVVRIGAVRPGLVMLLLLHCRLLLLLLVVVVMRVVVMLVASQGGPSGAPQSQ